MNFGKSILAKAGLALMLGLGATLGSVANAALLGVTINQAASATDTAANLPYFSGDNSGVMTFTVADRVLFIDQTASGYRVAPGASLGRIGTPKNLDIKVKVATDGSVTGVTGHDLVVQGVLTIDGVTYSGNLVTGEVVGFGFRDGGSNDDMDFRFRVTGGSMAAFYTGRDIGVKVSLENSTTFSGNFNSNFSAGPAKTSLGGIGALCVDLEKQISLDGVSWADADTAGAADVPVASVPSDAQYRLAVNNCGTGNLVNTVVTDSTLGVSYSIGALAAGATQTVTSAQVPALFVVDRCDRSGTLINSARVTAKSSVTTETVADNDDAVLICTTAPLIDIRKEISVDGGLTWLDANTGTDAPVVTAPHGAAYRFIVTNTGTANLTSVLLNDATLAITDYVVGDLATGVSVTIGSGEIAAATVAERCAGPGEFTNVASISGQSVDDGSLVTDSDPAVLVCAGQPQLTVRKEISVDGGLNWGDANAIGDASTPIVTYPHGAEYRFIVTNIGEVALQNVIVNDAELGITDYAVAGPLAAGDSVTIGAGDIAALSVATRCDASGAVTNVVTVSGDSMVTGETSSASDTAVMVCIGEPAIQLLKQISLDGSNWIDADDVASALSAHYPSDAYYRFVVTNVGTVTLNDVAVNDPDLGVIATIGQLLVGEQVTVDSATVPALFVTDRCTAEGNVANVAEVVGTAADSGAAVSDSDPAMLTCTAPPLAALGDFVWLDMNQDGIQDVGEDGVDDVRVDLLDLAGNVISSQLTSGGGYYLFGGLQPGSYSVVFYPPANMAVTVRDAGTDDALDSDADLVTGQTGVYTLAAGETNLTVDAGLYPMVITDCGCEGKVTDLTLRYLGDTTARVKVMQKKDGSVVFDADVAPGGSFSFSGTDKKGTLTTEIYIFVNGVQNARIHTSCSVPVGPGLIAGDFEVLAGASRGFPNLCPVDAPPPVDPPPASADGTMGCTPGYWRQKQHFGNWGGYAPADLYASVFEDAFPGLVLGDVVRMKGGDLNALGRHTVAALLNAASSEVDYGMTTQEVIDAFNAVYPGPDSGYEALKDKFAGMNERGCPLANARL